VLLFFPASQLTLPPFSLPCILFSLTLFSRLPAGFCLVACSPPHVSGFCSNASIYNAKIKQEPRTGGAAGWPGDGGPDQILEDTRTKKTCLRKCWKHQ
jgi:hypothetical protein